MAENSGERRKKGNPRTKEQKKLIVKEGEIGK
jgi:hypothetical protein